MNIRRELEKKIERKKEEVVVLERSIAEANSYIQALEDTLKMLPRNSLPELPRHTLRPGTEVAKIEEILRKEGKPMHIDVLLERLGKAGSPTSKLSLGGSLSTYVRDQKVFTRPAPNTFGLIEFGYEKREPEPPEEFGLLKSA